MRFLIQYRRWLLPLSIVLVGLSGYFVSTLTFQSNVDFFFPRGDHDFVFLKRYTAALEPDDLYQLVAIDNGKNVFEPAFLQKLAKFTREARRLPHITEAQSLTTLQDFAKTPLGLMPFPLVHPNGTPERIALDSTNLSRDPRFAGNLFSHDNTIVNVVLKTDTGLDQGETVVMMDSLNGLIKRTGFASVHLAGKPSTQVSFVDRTKKELIFYTLLSIGIFIVALILVYRTLWGVLVPLGTVILGLSIFMGSLGVVGLKLDLMSPLYPILMIIFGISGVIHVQSRYILMLKTISDKKEAALQAAKTIALPVFLTSFTTAVGFIVLVTNKIEPIRIFGVASAIGVMLAFMLLFALTVPWLSTLSALQLDRKAGGTGDDWKPFNLWLYRINHKFGLQIWLIAAVITGASLYGMSLIRTNVTLLSDLGKTDPARVDFDFIENKLGGVRAYEVAILPQKGYGMTSLPVLAQTSRLEAHIQQAYPIKQVLSVNTLVKSMHKSFNGSTWAAYRLPETQGEVDEYFGLLKMAGPKLTRALMSTDGKIGRISGRIHDVGSDSIGAINSRLRTWIAANTDKNVAQYRITGIATLVDKNHQYMREGLLSGLAIAYIVICVVLMLVFRDWRAFPVTVIPNTLPLLLAAAFMGFLGIELKASTSIIFTVSYGVAVNNTIHFLAQYLVRKKQGLPHEEAMELTFVTTGKPIIISSLMLLSGFVSLLFSTFSGTYYIGLLTFITVSAALVSDSFLTPQCINWLYGREKKQLVSSSTPPIRAI